MSERGFRPEHNNVRDTSRKLTAHEFFAATCKQERDRTTFIDPTTREILATDTLPNFLLRDSNLRDGYDFLKEFGKSIDIQILFARHDADRPDVLGDTTFNFEGRVQTSDIVLLEGLGWNEAVQQMLQALSHRLDVSEAVLHHYLFSDGHDTSTNPSETINQYKLREVQAIAKSGKHISFYDVDNSSDQFHIREQLIEGAAFTTHLSETLQPPQNIPEEEAKKVKDLGIAKQIFALEAIREWFMVANTGYQVAIACQNNPDLMEKLAQGNLKVLMVVGESHRDIVRKFQTAEVTATPESPLPASEQSIYMQKFLSQGYATTADLREFIGLPPLL
jgi:hypothetical protein